MKTIKMTLVLILTAAFLVACGGGAESVTLCEGDLAGIEGATGTVEYIAKGDNVVGYRTVQNIPFAAFGTEDTQAIKDAMEVSHLEFDLTDNVEYSYDYTDDAIIATIEIKNLPKATSDEFEFAGLSVTEGARISLSQTIEAQESTTSMTCTTQE